MAQHGMARHGDPSQHQTVGEATRKHPLLQNKPKPICLFSKTQLLCLANIINLRQAPVPAAPPHAGTAQGEGSGWPSEAASQQRSLAAGWGQHEELLPEAARELCSAKD